MLKIAWAAIVILLGGVVLVLLVGYSLPKSHVAARAIVLRAKPENVFAVIADFKNAPSWREGLEGVEMLAPQNGYSRFREQGKHGAITYQVIEIRPPRTLVTQIADRNLPFGGEWIFDVLPQAEGTRVHITERGEIYNPVFRFVSRFILGYTGTMDSYLKSLARKFGEEAVISEGGPAS
jgi:uncharacterized protein YndB with AHSA1/START domain